MSALRIIILTPLLCIATVIAGCALLLSIPVHRRLDAAPIRFVTSSGAYSLPGGQADASFEMHTGGDQMSIRHWTVGLGFVVRYGDTFIHQLFANCENSGWEGPYSPDLQVHPMDSTCDDSLYRLSTDGAVVRVQEIRSGRLVRTVSEVPLPGETRSILYNDDLDDILFDAENYEFDLIHPRRGKASS